MPPKTRGGRQNSKKKTAHQNPLLNDVVISKVFSFLHAEDLSRCRIVCTAWKNVGTPLLQDKMDNIVLRFNGQQQQDLMLNFLNMASSSNLTFSYFSFENYSLVDSWVISKFFKKFGPSISKLRLNYSGLDTTKSNNITCSQFRELMINKAPFVEELELINLPEKLKENRPFESGKRVRSARPSLSLRKIKLRLQYGEYGADPYGPQFLGDLFRYSLGLEEVSVDSNYDSEEDCKQILQLLVIANRVNNLTVLELDQIDKESMEILATKFNSARLKKFVSFTIGKIVGRHLEEFLNSQKDTMEYLGLKITGIEDFVLALPEMKNLRTLDVWLSNWPGNARITPRFKPIQYTRDFPKLETLKFGLYDPLDPLDRHRINFYNPEELFPDQSTPSTTLRYLTLPQGIQNAETLRNISRIFPQIVKLSLASQKDEILPVVWEVWPQIEILALCINDSGFTLNPRAESRQHINDSIFTGIPQDKCKILHKVLKQGKTINWKKYEHFIAGPSICNLTKLRRLVIHGGEHIGKITGYSISDEITDVTGYMAFSKLTTLVDLNLITCPQKISKMCSDFLSLQLDLPYAGPTVSTWIPDNHMLRLARYLPHSPAERDVFVDVDLLE